MYKHSIDIRVRYGETDRMGYVYYGNYALYYEQARTEALRLLGVSYKSLEDSGILMPVLDFNIKYIRPAYYDSLLKVTVSIPELPTGARMLFKYDCEDPVENIILNVGSTTLVFVDKKTNKPTRAPKQLIDVMRKFY